MVNWCWVNWFSVEWSFGGLVNWQTGLKQIAVWQFDREAHD